MDCLWAGIERSFGAQSSASLVHCHRNSEYASLFRPAVMEPILR